MANMRRPEGKGSDRRVWIEGSNGITCVRWLSTVQDRMDINVVCDYVEGDQFPHDVTERKPITKKAAATPANKKATVVKEEED